jgi:hypothetical protein
VLEPVCGERLREWIGTEGNRTEREGRIQLMHGSGLYYFLRSLGLVTGDGKSNRVPEALWKAPREAVKGFLQAVFTADGTVNLAQSARSCSVRLASSEPEFLKEVSAVVDSSSAKIDDVQSELIFNAEHTSIHTTDRAILEVRRILQEPGLFTRLQQRVQKPPHTPEQIPLIEEWFDKIGESLPTSMRDELEALKQRLG